MDLKRIEDEARAFSIPLAQQVCREANSKPSEELGVFAGTAASLILQTVLVAMLIQKYPPVSKEGKEQLELLHDQAKRDAIERWNKPDLARLKRHGELG